MTAHDALNQPEQRPVRCVIMRGGTSKGLYFSGEDMPPEGPDRDRLLTRLMGSPDILQIDGLGGSRAVTSKVAIVSPSAREDADLDYTFAQVDIESELVGYVGNCGNISSGVGPFAIDEGLVDAGEPETTVRIYNTNTDKVLVARVPVRDGKARVAGSCEIAGVPGSGAPILMDYSGTVGAITGQLLPTGNPVERMELENGVSFDVTLCDVANPCAILPAEALGISCNETPDELTANAELMAAVGEIQSKAGQRFGIWPDWHQVPAPGFPLVILLAPPGDYTDVAGEPHGQASMDLRAQLFFIGKCHDSMAGTGATCLAAASRILGSVAHRMLPPGEKLPDELRIGHPMGVMDVLIEVDPETEGADLRFAALGFVRTARRLMEGTAYVPTD